MKSKTNAWRLAVCAAGTACLLLAAGLAYPQQPAPAKKAPAAATLTESQAKASEILTRMATFMAGAQRFSMTVHGDYDAVQASGQKVEFGETRKVTLNRPNQLRVEGERSDGAKMLAVFNGKEIMLIDGANNVYATEPQPGGLDDSIIHFVKDLRMQLPLAMLLVTQLPEELKNRVRSIDYVEKTKINGIAVHHLAARDDTVDFQVWVADGEQPLPQRVVITYKNAKGEPQFRADLTDWNLAPAVTDTTFAATPPPGAQKIAFAAQLARSTVAARKQSAAKGVK